MSKKQLFLFSFTLALIFGNGSGFVTLIPVYLSRLGVESDKIGYLFSILYFGMAVSGVLAGWLADKFGRHKLMCILSAGGQILASLLMLWGAKSFVTLAIALFISWFLAGFHAPLISTLVALQAKENERGRVFGIVGFITGLGPVFTGFIYGKFVDNYGFDALFVLNIGISVLWTILSMFYRQPSTMRTQNDMGNRPASSPLPGSFYLVILAAILGWLAINGGRLGITLVMTRLDFSANDISLTVGIASLVALAMPLILGWLSDYTGRKPLLLALNFLGFAGLFLITRQPGLIGYCVASSLLSLYSCFSGISNALITDLMPKESLGLGLSLINGTSFIAGIFSSTLMGVAVSSLGITTPFFLAMFLPFAAAVLVGMIREKSQAFALSSEPE